MTSGQVPTSPLEGLAVGMGRRVLARSFLSRFDRESVRGQMRAVVDFKVLDRTCRPHEIRIDATARRGLTEGCRAPRVEATGKSRSLPERDLEAVLRTLTIERRPGSVLLCRPRRGPVPEHRPSHRRRIRGDDGRRRQDRPRAAENRNPRVRGRVAHGRRAILPRGRRLTAALAGRWLRPASRATCWPVSTTTTCWYRMRRPTWPSRSSTGYGTAAPAPTRGRSSRFHAGLRNRRTLDAHDVQTAQDDAQE